MCKGELDISDTTKFTGSALQSGKTNIHIHMTHKMAKLTVSLNVNKCLNLIFNLLDEDNPPGMLLPVK
jgi:hypothetical protein